MVAGLAIGRWRPRLRWPYSPDAQLVSLLLVFIAIMVVPGVQFRRAEGAVHNQMLGIAWAVVLLIAVSWAWGRRRPTAAVFGAGAVVLAFACGVSPWIQRRLDYHFSVVVPSVGAHVAVTEISPPLIRYARHHVVYHPALSWISALREPRVYPNQENIQQMLAAGYQPGYLARAFLDRHFDAIYLQEDRWARALGAGTGTWEDNYIWKLNEVVRAKYRPAYEASRGLRGATFVPFFFGFHSAGFYVRRPGPDPAPWMRDCFAPFHIATLSWSIRRGGGFWCRPGGRGTVMRLVRTPAVESELRTTSSGNVLVGQLYADLPRELGTFSVGLGPWRVDGQRVGGRIRLRMIGHDRVYASHSVAGHRVRLRFRGRLRENGELAVDRGLSSALVTFPISGEHPASVRASQNSGAAVDLGQLALERLR
jgi:hypothetical protein